MILQIIHVQLMQYMPLPFHIAMFVIQPVNTSGRQASLQHLVQEVAGMRRQVLPQQLIAWHQHIVVGNAMLTISMYGHQANHHQHVLVEIGINLIQLHQRQTVKHQHIVAGDVMLEINMYGHQVNHQQHVQVEVGINQTQLHQRQTVKHQQRLIPLHSMQMEEHSVMVQPHGPRKSIVVQQTIIAKWRYQH